MAEERAEWMLDERLMRVVFAVGATLIGAVSLTTRDDPAIDWSLLAPTVLVFWLWAVIERFPRWPLYLLGLAVPQVLNFIDAQKEVSIFFIVLTVAILAAFEPNRLVAVALIVTTLVSILLLSFLEVFDDLGWQNWLFGILFSWGFGEIVYRYKLTIEEVKRARLLVADQAAVHERRRIARDVHDLVGHSLSVVMLHVTGARHLLHKDPDEAERALQQAEAAGRESLAEIRRTVGLLRDEGDAAQNALPSPDLTDVSELVREFVHAGLDVSLAVDGPIDRVIGAPALAGYRIVQEALTNVSRHTKGSRVEVAVAVGEVSYDLGVRNHGGTATERQKGSGFGLVSMRERARSVGGSLIAGPTHSGWTVEATLPVSSAAANV